ncbi:hypothetical protein [Parasphingorhabdus sp.]|uniref:Y-family DNA polymerase n=1 Tax=Parasphingorhabdus sp. TaxID=2709688 RepID=UPI002F950CB3
MFSCSYSPTREGHHRKPATTEHLYLDFDRFFAPVEQLRDPSLRGRPVDVVPYEGDKTCIIACSRDSGRSSKRYRKPIPRDLYSGDGVVSRY